MSKKSRNVIFSEKNPAGMPTHRTGVDNIKNQRQKSSRIRMLQKLLTLLGFGPENQNLVISISTISIY